MVKICGLIMVRLEEQQESVQRCLPLPRSRLPGDFFLLWQLALSPRDLHGFTENQAVVFLAMLLLPSPVY